MQKKTIVVCIAAVLAAVGVRAQDTNAPVAKGWESELVGGLNLTAGNSKTLAWNAGAATQHKTDANEFKAKGEYKFGQSTVVNDAGREVDETTTKAAQGESQYNRFLSETLYGVAKVTGLYDDIAAIDYRVIGGPGLGQYLIRKPDLNLSIEFGVAYLFEEVGDESDKNALFRVSQRFEETYDAGSKIWQSAEYLPQSDDFGVYLLNAEIGAEALISGALSLRVVMQDRYDSEPAEDREQNDLSVTAGIVYKM